jgi:hypothetical protein
MISIVPVKKKHSLDFGDFCLTCDTNVKITAIIISVVKIIIGKSGD